MALKPEQKIFIKWLIKTGDHIVSYQKAFPQSDRKTAATAGKRWLKNVEIAKEIEKRGRKNDIDAGTNDETANPSVESMNLPPLQKRFCQEYLIDLNATMAAVRAGYSIRSAGSQAHDLLKKPEIRIYIQELISARSKRVEIDADKVLQELAFIAFSKVTDFLRVEATEAPAEYAEANPMPDDDDDVEENDNEIKTPIIPYKHVDIFDTDFIDPKKLTAIASIKQGRNGIELKLHDKPKALELLGRHLAMWNDKLAVNADEQLVNLYKTVMSAK